MPRQSGSVFLFILFIHQINLSHIPVLALKSFSAKAQIGVLIHRVLFMVNRGLYPVFNSSNYRAVRLQYNIL